VESTSDFLERLAAELVGLHAEAPEPLRARLLSLRDDAVMQRTRLGEQAMQRVHDGPSAHLEPELPSPPPAPGHGAEEAAAAPVVCSSCSTPPPALSRPPSSNPGTPTYGDTDHAAGRLQSRWRARSLRSSPLGATIASLRQRGRGA